MRLYRFGQQPYITDLSGQGGLFFRGRWHLKGTQILYTAEHLSLAKLEKLSQSRVLPVDQFLLTLEVPSTATIKLVEVADLPTEWDTVPYLPQLAAITEEWLREGKFWLMRVPSVHSPNEYNYLLNPLHPDHAQLRIVSLEPHPFDARLK